MYEIKFYICTHIVLLHFSIIIIKVSFKSAYSVLQHQQLSEEYMEFSADILETVNVSRKVLAGKKQETTGELPDQLVL